MEQLRPTPDPFEPASPAQEIPAAPRVLLPGEQASLRVCGKAQISINPLDDSLYEVQVLALPGDAHGAVLFRGGSVGPSARLEPRARPPARFPRLRLPLLLTILSLGWQHLQTRLRARRSETTLTLAGVLFGLALVVYLVTRLVGITHFPIFFFTDEAVQTVLAADLVHNGLRDYNGTLLPTYFKNGTYYNLSTSVYLQVLPYLFFGKSVAVTRGVSVLMSMLAAASVALILKDIFRLNDWWLGAALLSTTPAWFLHSRTAFETGLFVSFYALGFYFYLLYRCRAAGYLYPAVIFMSLAFYTYSPGQAIVIVTASLLLLSDLPYHWRHRPVVLGAAGLAALLVLPYLRFRLTQPVAVTEHLRLLNSYWVQQLPLSEKLARFGGEYLRAFSPGYWFFPNEIDLARHRLGSYGHLLKATLPFVLAGLGIALANVRSAPHRALLLALLAAPAGTALVGLGITRVLVMVIPATILTTLGLSAVVGWLSQPALYLQGVRLRAGLAARLRPLFEGRLPGVPPWLEEWHLPPVVVSVAVFVTLAGANIAMLRDALVNGPLWYRDYGLNGMQYGAVPLFSAIQDYIDTHEPVPITLSPIWTNGTDVVARFFLPDPLPIKLGSVRAHMNERLPLTDDMLFIIVPDEYNEVVESGKFKDIEIEQVLPYPDDRPGFYFVHLRYADEIDTILAAEQTARRQLQEDQIMIAGQPVGVRYSMLDIGQVTHIFDGDPYSLTRTFEANPAIIELAFPEARTLQGLRLIVGSTVAQITVWAAAGQGEETVAVSTVQTGTVENPQVTFNFPAPLVARWLRIEVKDIHQGEPGHIHIWEIEFIEE